MKRDTLNYAAGIGVCLQIRVLFIIFVNLYLYIYLYFPYTTVMRHDSMRNLLYCPMHPPRLNSISWTGSPGIDVEENLSVVHNRMTNSAPLGARKPVFVVLNTLNWIISGCTMFGMIIYNRCAVVSHCPFRLTACNWWWTRSFRLNYKVYIMYIYFTYIYYNLHHYQTCINFY